MRIESKVLAALMMVGLTMSARGQEEAASASASPLTDGPYLGVMGTYIINDKNGDAFDNGYGGTLAAGFRNGWWAFEGSFIYARERGSGTVRTGIFKTEDAQDTNAWGGTLNALVFPFRAVPGLFALVGAGGLDVNRHPIGRDEYSLATVEGGVGYLVPLHFGRYDFAARFDTRYRYGWRENNLNAQGESDDEGIPSHYTDILINLGLQLPLGIRPPPAPAPAAPVAVVALAAPVDTDGDGVPDDRDQCPNTPAGTQVNDVGCPLAPPPCKSPEAGQKADLSGCAVGDTVTLRGVNFDFDKATLTLNAKTILDDVVAALIAAPDIRFEIGGHTDSKGSDSYNQKLSEERATSVMTYLGEHGVDADRMSAVGYGETQPIAENDTDEGREINRRVELKITAGANPQAAAAAPVVDASTPVEDLPPAPEASVQ